MFIFMENEIEDVYGLMTGILEEPTSTIPSLVQRLEKRVENAFIPGNKCAMLDNKIFALREKIADRLNTTIDADEDLLALANLYEELQKELCIKMFIQSRFLLHDALQSEMKANKQAKNIEEI